MAFDDLKVFKNIVIQGLKVSPNIERDGLGIPPKYMDSGSRIPSETLFCSEIDSKQYSADKQINIQINRESVSGLRPDDSKGKFVSGIRRIPWRSSGSGIGQSAFSPLNPNIN